MTERKTINIDHDPNEKIVETLPLLDYLNKQYQIDSQKPFFQYKILAVQHLLGSTLPMFAQLQRGGTKPEDTYIVGKAYSSHPAVVDRLRSDGYRVAEGVFDFAADRPYDSSLEQNIRRSFEQLIHSTDFSSGNARGLIIDDGGKAIKMLYEQYPQLSKYFTGVEQTSRGARVVQSLQLVSPVINVARSDAKTRIESPLIAQSMVDEFFKSLERWRGVVDLPNNKILMLGYGFIGENVAKILRDRGFSISVFEQDDEKKQKARINGNAIIDDRQKALASATTIIGCTGTEVIPQEEYDLIATNTLLVNMASTDTEFSAWELRKKGTVIHEHRLAHDFNLSSHPEPLPWRSLYRIQEQDTSFFLANGGFPIDFSGSIDPIDPMKIQLTRGLLLGAALQAVNTTEAGFIELDQTLQKNIVEKYLQLQQNNY